MIRYRGVSKRYGGEVAVDRVDLHVASGTTCVLIGPSGCGKSTLLRMVVGLVRPSDGDVVFAGQRVRDATLGDVRRQVGYVIQEGGLFPHLTVAQNVTLSARFQGRQHEAIEARVREVARLARFPLEALERYPAELSGGQRQRASLMRALMLDPPVLLLDEPLGALDPMIRFDLQGDLKEIFRLQGKTVLMVTHDLHEAHFFSDDVVLMNAGRIEQRGAIPDFLAAPESEFVSRFVRAQRSADF